jgi:uncharacterized protein (DUF58 family)
MPSRFGLAFGVMALVLFFMAVGYANNLIYLIVFFLISVGFTGILVTNKNIQHLQFENLKNPDLFATEDGELILAIHNKSQNDCWDVQARLEKTDIASDKILVPSLSSEELKIFFTAPHRGQQPLPRIILESTYPFGLLRAWKVFTSVTEILIFAERKGSPNFPRDSITGEGTQNQGLFRDHRIFQSADPLGRIDWKASARRQEILVKNFEEPEKPTLHFSWDQTKHLGNHEDRISQLALWIDQAEKTGHTYSLSVVLRDVPPSKGLLHWRECQGILAQLPKEDLL